MRILVPCLLILFAGERLLAQNAPPNMWTATSTTGLTLGGTWTADPGPTRESVIGTWTLVNAQGSKMAEGGWSASKSPDGWIGKWRAVNSGGTTEVMGSWNTRVDLKASAQFSDLFEKAAQTIITGNWRFQNHSGAWTIRAQAPAKTTWK